MSDTTVTFQKVLDQVGFATIDTLWATIANATATGDDFGARTLTAIATKLTELETAERQIVQALKTLPGQVEREKGNFDLGWDVDGAWIAQSAQTIAEAQVKRRTICADISMLVYILNGPKQA